jgi:transcriptional regulator with XRE-family HTH domain
MARKWADIRRQLSPEREGELRDRVQRELDRLSLPQLRHARKLTQVSLSRTLNVNQGAVSKLEQRTDAYISTLRSYLKAMGADLQIRAVFPDTEIEISQFEDIDSSASSRTSVTKPDHAADRHPRAPQTQPSRSRRSA